MEKIRTMKVPMERKHKVQETSAFCDLSGEVYLFIREYLLALMACIPEAIEVFKEIYPLKFFAIENCFGLETGIRQSPKVVIASIYREFSEHVTIKGLDFFVGKALCCLGLNMPFSDNIQDNAQSMRERIEGEIVATNEQQPPVILSPFQAKLFQFLRTEMAGQGKIVFGHIIWRGNYTPILKKFVQEENLNPDLKWLHKWLFDQVLCLSRKGLVLTTRKRGNTQPAYYFLKSNTQIEEDKENTKIAKKLKEAKMLEQGQGQERATLSPFAYDFLVYLFNLLKEKPECIDKTVTQLSFAGVPTKELISFVQDQYEKVIDPSQAGIIWSTIKSREGRRPNNKIILGSGKRGVQQYTLLDPSVFAERDDQEFPTISTILGTGKIKDKKKKDEAIPNVLIAMKEADISFDTSFDEMVDYLEEKIKEFHPIIDEINQIFKKWQERLDFFKTKE